jgi:hypothetical protein
VIGDWSSVIASGVGTPKALKDSAQGEGFAKPWVTQKNAFALKERKKFSKELGYGSDNP